MTPDAVAVRHGDREFTYRELRDRVAALAAGLAAKGVRTGDRVAYLGPNHPAYLEVLFACGQLGAVFVPVNFRLTPAEIDYVLGDAGASILVHTPEHSPAQLTHQLTTIPVDNAYEALLNSPHQTFDEPVGLDDTCLIMYTSGSTGRPKGAMLTHGNLTWNSINVIIENDFTSHERALLTAPLFHIATLGMVCLPTLLKGGRVLLHSSFDPGATLDAIENERATVMFGVPTMYDAISASERWATADLSSLRVLLCGGAPVPTSTIHRYLDRGIAFVQGYGMTETSPGALILDSDHVTTKIGSAGVPSFFTDVRLVDADGKPAERGEITVSGPNVMRGYWHNQAATDAALRDGWFHSGDIATVDEDGYFRVIDRLKDMIISGGENIYPAEVENEIHAFPGVERCAVIGVPDEKWGEVGKAVIVPSPGTTLDAGELLTFLRKRLAGYKVPKSVELVDSLPTTGSGKILKAKLRERYA